MSDTAERLAQADRALRQALAILAHPVNLQPEEWMLVATLVGEADLVAREEQQRNPTSHMPLLEQAVTELREITGGFTDKEFLMSTGAARRRNTRLFAPTF